MRNLNDLDQQVTAIMVKAERRFAGDPLHTIVQNEKMKEIKAAIRFWQIFISGTKTNRNFITELIEIRTSLSESLQIKIESYYATPEIGLRIAQDNLKTERNAQIKLLKEQEEMESAMLAEAEQCSLKQIENKRTTGPHTQHIFGATPSIQTEKSTGIHQSFHS